MSNLLFKNTVIFGLGLIGGSFCKSLKDLGLCQDIYGHDISENNLDLAHKAQIIVGNITQIKEKELDLIIIATTLDSYPEIFDIISNKLKISEKTLIIDLGSLKKFAKDSINEDLKNNFIGCHPIAGSHKSGFANSEVDLFKNKDFVICRNKFCSQELHQKLTLLIEKIGSNIVNLSEKEHDKIFALTSHLPQFLSFLTKEFSPKKINDPFFKKLFRLDNSNPKIWEDIFNKNADNLEEIYFEFFNHFEENIDKFYNNELEIAFLEPKNIDNSKQNTYDREFLAENFAVIFFRYIIVKSYLKLFENNDYKKYIGDGFRDFTAISEIKFTKSDNLMISKNKSKILSYFDLISDDDSS